MHTVQALKNVTRMLTSLAQLLVREREKVSEGGLDM